MKLFPNNRHRQTTSPTTVVEKLNDDARHHHMSKERPSSCQGVQGHPSLNEEERLKRKRSAEHSVPCMVEVCPTRDSTDVQTSPSMSHHLLTIAKLQRDVEHLQFALEVSESEKRELKQEIHFLHEHSEDLSGILELARKENRMLGDAKIKLERKLKRSKAKRRIDAKDKFVRLEMLDLGEHAVISDVESTNGDDADKAVRRQSRMQDPSQSHDVESVSEESMNLLCDKSRSNRRSLGDCHDDEDSVVTEVSCLHNALEKFSTSTVDIDAFEEDSLVYSCDGDERVEGGIDLDMTRCAISPESEDGTSSRPPSSTTSSERQTRQPQSEYESIYQNPDKTLYVIKEELSEDFNESRVHSALSKLRRVQMATCDVKGKGMPQHRCLNAMGA